MLLIEMEYMDSYSSNFASHHGLTSWFLLETANPSRSNNYTTFLVSVYVSNMSKEGDESRSPI